MAQAARLNLRMQKELKLLLTDPPPGASFPSLSDEASAPSLTSIDALFRGPEGTVYANGVFKINIQIPERYPFQPPIVTFATPIYHPNIDNGGRICLDILNLPPKGTWQPSLNISTVLTSIGLLLSEPNPDDGLMHEASREYKYNRQAFDQKARSMTEKYARAGESQIQTGQSTAHTEMKESDASIFDLGSSSNSISGLGKVPINNFSKKLVHIGQIETANNISTEHKGNPGKLHAGRSKLSLKADAPHIRTGENTNLDLPNRSSMLETITNKDYIDTTVTKEQETSRCVKTGQSGNADKQHIPKGSLLSSSRLEKVGLVGSIPSPEHLEDEKENLAPIPHSSSRISSALSEKCKYYDGRKEKKAAILRLKLSDMADNPPLIPVEQLPSSTNEESPISESVIVLDSEDSEDENIPVRSKLSLAKRCMSRKRKSGFRQVNKSSCNSSSNSMS